MRFLIAACLVFAACGKKDSNKGTAAEQKTDDKGASTTPTPTPPGGGGGGSIANAAEYEAKGTALTNELLGMFKATAKDKNCDRLASDINKFVSANKGTFEAIKKFEDANPEAEKAMDAKMEARSKEFESTGAAVIEACKDHAGLQAAMNSLPTN